jgi:hypothetical protein
VINENTKLERSGVARTIGPRLKRRVEIELPWVMQLLRDTIAKRVRGRGVALLERPPGEA